MKRRGMYINNALLSLLIGTLSGIVVEYFHVYTYTPDIIFAGITVWIMICTVIAVVSPRPSIAALNVCMFCGAMVAAYYLTAHFSGYYYIKSHIYVWSALTAVTPLLAYPVWYAGGKGPVKYLISAIIIMSMPVSAFTLFGINRFDLLFTVLTAAFLLMYRK